MKITLKTACVAFFACCTTAMAGTSANLDSDTLATDSIGFVKKTDIAECHLTADFPRNGTTVLHDSIVKHINRQLGRGTEENITNGYSLLVVQGDSIFADIFKEALNGRNYGYHGPAYTKEINVKKMHDEKNTVTYATEAYEYLGGAHPFSVYTGVTFAKQDGKVLDYKIFKDTTGNTFRKVLIDGLKGYFEVKSDAELVNCLLDIKRTKDIPLPATPPFFTDKGIMLIYGQYEIAPYAAGMPAVTIPFEQAKPLLTDSALMLLE